MNKTTRNTIAVVGAVLIGAPLLHARAGPDKTPLSVPSEAFEQALPLNAAQKDAHRLIRQISSKAAQAARHADALQSVTRSVSRHRTPGQASELTGVKQAVNAMAASLRELETLRPGALPWQQAVIDELQPMLAALAGHTTDAIVGFEEKRAFPSSGYREAVAKMDESARSIRAFTQVHLDYADAREDLNRLEAAGWEPKTLTGRVRGEMLRLPYYGVFDHLTFQVADGQVTLSGQVTRPSLKDAAERSVRSVEGVESLSSSIEVLPVSLHDDRIRLATYRAIYGHSTLARYRLNPHPPIRIIVANGNVALHGTVATELDRNLAHIEASSVPEAFSVTNHLEVGG